MSSHSNTISSLICLSRQPENEDGLYILNKGSTNTIRQKGFFLTRVLICLFHSLKNSITMIIIKNNC